MKVIGKMTKSRATGCMRQKRVKGTRECGGRTGSMVLVTGFRRMGVVAQSSTTWELKRYGKDQP